MLAGAFALLESVPDRFSSIATHPDERLDSRRANAFGQLSERERSEHNSDLLHSATQSFPQLLSILGRDLNTRGTGPYLTPECLVHHVRHEA